MASDESKNSDTTHFDMRPVNRDEPGGSGLGILLVLMALAVPALLVITYLMVNTPEPGQELPGEITPGFLEAIPLNSPPELDGPSLLAEAPEEHPGELAIEISEPAPDGTPEELLQVETMKRRAARPRRLITDQEPEPEWQKEIRAQLEKRISFDFVDTPLADVVAFLTNLTNTNMVLDPAAVEGDDVPVTLKVSDMKLVSALDWILRLVNLTYTFSDEAIFISTPARIQSLPSVRNKQIVFRVYDLREQLKEDGREVLLDVIRNSIAADWEAPEAILRFVDGRLMIRHRWIVVGMVEEMMDEFLRASGVEPPKKPSPKTGSVKAKVVPRVCARMRDELPLNGAVELERARNVLPNIDSLDSFWANYFGAVKRGSYPWAKRLCLVDGLKKTWPETEQSELNPGDFDRLVREVDVMETILKRAENGFRMKRFIRYRGLQGKLSRIENGLLHLRTDKVEIGVRIGQFEPGQIWRAVEAANRADQFHPAGVDHRIYAVPGFTFTDGARVMNLRDMTLFQISFGSPEKALALIEKSKEAKLDFEIYRPFLKRRLAAMERARALPKDCCPE